MQLINPPVVADEITLTKSGSTIKFANNAYYMMISNATNAVYTPATATIDMSGATSDVLFGVLPATVDISIDVVISTDETAVFGVGVGDTIMSGDGAINVVKFVRGTSANTIRAVTAVGGVTTVSGDIAFTSDGTTYKTFRIDINGNTNAEFFINGVSKFNSNTNLPNKPLPLRFGCDAGQTLKIKPNTLVIS